MHKFCFFLFGSPTRLVLALLAFLRTCTPRAATQTRTVPPNRAVKARRRNGLTPLWIGSPVPMVKVLKGGGGGN